LVLQGARKLLQLADKNVCATKKADRHEAGLLVSS